MLSLDHLDKFIIELIRFCRCINEKIPAIIWKQRVSVLIKDEVFILDMRKTELVNIFFVSITEILHMIENIIFLSFRFVNNDLEQNVIDRLVTDMISMLLKHPASDKDYAFAISEPLQADNELRRYLTDHFKKLNDEDIVEAASIECDSDVIMDDMTRKDIVTEDGYELDYFTYGIRHKPVLVLINAYGIPVRIWKYVIHHFSAQFRIITWESRGNLQSHDGIPLDNHLHADDLDRILHAEKVQEADFVCWCSGFKIMAEYYRICPETVRTISVICGYFNPLDSQKAFWTEFDKTIGKLSDLLVRDRQLIDSPFIIKLIEKLFSFDIKAKQIEGIGIDNQNSLLHNMISAPVPEAKTLITTPFKTRVTLLNYARITVGLQKHDVSDVLPMFECPVLIINAGQDIISDIKCAQIAASEIKNCRYEYLERSTHWCLWDDYVNVNRLIDQFLIKTEVKQVI